MTHHSDDRASGPSVGITRRMLLIGMTLTAAGAVGLSPNEARASLLTAARVTLGYGAVVGLVARLSNPPKGRLLKRFMKDRQPVTLSGLPGGLQYTFDPRPSNNALLRIGTGNATPGQVVPDDVIVGISRHIMAGSTLVPMARMSKSGSLVFLGIEDGRLYEVVRVAPEDRSCGLHAVKRMTEGAWWAAKDIVGNEPWTDPGLSLLEQLTSFPKFVEL